MNFKFSMQISILILTFSFLIIACQSGNKFELEGVWKANFNHESLSAENAELMKKVFTDGITIDFKADNTAEFTALGRTKSANYKYLINENIIEMEEEGVMDSIKIVNGNLVMEEGKNKIIFIKP